MADAGLSVKVSISTDNIYNSGGVSAYTGAWLNVNDGSSYKIAKGSFENSATTFRKDEVTNPFVEGKYVVNALRENVTEALNIYVLGTDNITVRNRIQTLVDAIRVNQFLIKVTLGNAQQIWQCFAADFTINTQLEFLHSRRATVNMTVTRNPTVILSTDSSVTTGA